MEFVADHPVTCTVNNVHQDSLWKVSVFGVKKKTDKKSMCIQANMVFTSRKHWCLAYTTSKLSILLYVLLYTYLLCQSWQVSWTFGMGFIRNNFFSPSCFEAALILKFKSRSKLYETVGIFCTCCPTTKLNVYVSVEQYLIVSHVNFCVSKTDWWIKEKKEGGEMK